MQHSGENYAQSYKALINSKIFSIVGVSRSKAILWLSKESGFSKIYFSSRYERTIVDFRPIGKIIDYISKHEN